MIKRIIAAAAVVVALVLCGTWYMENKRIQAEDAHMAEIKAQAQVYEKEQQEIRRELDKQKRAIDAKNEFGTAIVGYHVTTSAHLDFVKKQAEQYHFHPVIVLDCTAESALIEEVKSFDAELVLMSLPFEEDAIKEMAQKTGCESFLLNYEDETKENLQILYDIGFTRLIRYKGLNFTELEENQTVNIGYTYLNNKNVKIGNRIDNLVFGKDSLVIIFNLDSDLTEEIITEKMLYVEKNIKNGEIAYGTLADVEYDIRNAESNREKRRLAYEENAAKQQKRLDELDELIREIYSHWNEVEE